MVHIDIMTLRCINIIFSRPY